MAMAPLRNRVPAGLGNRTSRSFSYHIDTAFQSAIVKCTVETCLCSAVIMNLCSIQ